MQDNGTWHINMVESALYRLPCTSSVVVTAQLTDARDLVVLRMLEQCNSCWWHFYHYCNSGLLPVVKRRCLASLKLLYHTPWSTRVQRRILSTAHAPNRDWTCQGCVWEPSGGLSYEPSTPVPKHDIYSIMYILFFFDRKNGQYVSKHRHFKMVWYFKGISAKNLSFICLFRDNSPAAKDPVY